MKNRDKYTNRYYATGIFVLVVVLCFSASIPFAAPFIRQMQAIESHHNDDASKQQDSDIPPANDMDEKNNAGLDDEYVYSSNICLYLPSPSITSYIYFSSRISQSHKGKLFCPPPDKG